MDEKYLDNIYLSLQGLLTAESAIPWIPDMFAPDSVCHSEYTAMRGAYERLCDRLGVDADDGDDDLNSIVDAMEKIQELLCKEMFRLGIQYAQSHL